jgi:hypothetical protein
MDMQEFLNAVAAGQVAFTARSEASVDLETFQPIVKLAHRAYSLGYVRSFRANREFSTGRNYCDAVLTGDLTEDGRHFVQSGGKVH